MFTVSVLNIKRIEGKKQLRAFFDISIGGEITIYGIRIMEDEKGYWIAYPQSSYESNGKTRHSPIVVVSEELKKQIKEAALKVFLEK